MSAWFSSAAASPPQAWLGLRAHADLALAARCAPAAPGGRPRVQFSPVLRGGDALARLWPWVRGQGRQTATCIVLPGAGYRIVPTEVPPVPAAERRQALRWQIRDQLDYPAEEAVVDGLLIPATTAGAQPRRMLAVAAHQDEVRALMQQCRSARVALRAIDIAETALRNLSVLAGGDRAHAFLHVGQHSSRLLLVWQREICTFRQFDCSCESIAAAAPHERGALLERIALDVQRTADAFVRQFHAAQLDTLWLCTDEPSHAALAELGQLLTLKVQPYVASQYLDLPPGAGLFDAAEGVDYTLAVGAALRH